MNKILRMLTYVLPVLGILLIATVLIYANYDKQRDIEKYKIDIEDTSEIVAKEEVKLDEEIEASESELDEDLSENTDFENEEEPIEIEEEPFSPVSLFFTGDICLTETVVNNYDEKGVGGVVSPDLLSLMTESDITFVNNEFPYSTRGTKAPDKQFTFRLDPKYISVIKDMGVDIATIANNHVLDYGKDALLDTFETFDNAEILYSGAGETLDRARELEVIEKNGIKFGFLSASRVIPVTSWNVEYSQPGVFCTYDPELLCEAIKKAKEEVDFLFVYVHWGIEKAAYPEGYQKEMGHRYIDSGADIVIGAHPHVLQGVEYYKDHPIFYSLGNYIFNATIDRTAALKVTVNEDLSYTTEFTAIKATGGYSYACEGDSETQIYDYIESISDNAVVDSDGVVTKKQ